MTLKNAATFAFVGTLLAAVLMIWDFVLDLMNVVQGVVPLARLLTSLLCAFAALSLVVFFYVFRKTQN